jgi:hypothetical protein
MSHPLRTAAAATFGSILLLGTLGLSPAGAEAPADNPGQARAAEATAADHGTADAEEHRAAQASDHDGDADSDSSTAYTEDNDTNDGGTPNNVADDGDNAHPSGRDRSVENGGSGNQGRAESDPDDDGHGPDRSNGGADKPNGSGGTDLADQDGNNGCGNDDDFEDDNEGWCGKPKAEETPAPETPAPAVEQEHEDTCASGSMAEECGHHGSTAGVESSDEGTCAEGAMSTECGHDSAGVEGESENEDVPATADTTEHRTSSGAGVCNADEDMFQGEWTMPDVCTDTEAGTPAPEVEDTGAVLGLELSRGATAEIAVPTGGVHAVSAAPAVLASLPLVGGVVSGSLPFTGSNTLVLTGAAALLLALGVVLVRATRSHTA